MQTAIESNVPSAVINSSIITSIASQELKDVMNDGYHYVRKKYNAKVYNNQIEIIDTILNPMNKYIAILGSRGSGKSWSVAMSIVELCQLIPGLIIAIFAPKGSQSKRLITECYKIISDATKDVQDKVNTKDCSTMKLIFNNNSIIYALSAHERTMSEGEHPNIIVIDESHMVSDWSMSAKILPMLGSHKYTQVIQIGVAMYKNHFNEAFNDSRYIKCISDWTQSDRLKESGVFKYTDPNGVYHEYAQYVVDIMPPEAKKKYFPDRPDLITGNGGVNYLDFMMQYELQWLDDISLFLSADQQKKLVSGTYAILDNPMPNGTYVFGLDTAGGSIDPDSLTLDFTQLSIWEYRAGIMIRVFGRSWQGDPILQYDEIKEVLKRFRTKYGLIDYSNIAINFVAMFKKDGINCDGIMYARSHPDSHKDYKTTMFENFMAKLNLGLVKYPNMADIDEKNPTITKDNINSFKDGFSEWCALQRIKSKNSDKVKINASRGFHDDICNADILSVYAINNVSTMSTQITTFPFLVSGATFSSGPSSGGSRFKG